LRTSRPCRSRGALRPGRPLRATANAGELRHVELTALEIDVPARNRKAICPVGHGFREPHHKFSVAVAQHLHLLGLAEDGRLLLTEIQTVQRDGLAVDVDERRQHRERLPAIEVHVQTQMLRFDALLLLIALTGFGSARLCTDTRAQDHHADRKLAVHVLHDNSSPGVGMSNRQTIQLSLI
jgi:hypothetical protein